jgi:hypothetical protein
MSHAGAVDNLELPLELWQRQCALCGGLDADHAWPEPVDDGEPWHCPRCEAVRWLWRPARHRHAAAR